MHKKTIQEEKCQNWLLCYWEHEMILTPLPQLFIFQNIL